MKIKYRLIKTTQRLTFDIIFQDDRFIAESDENGLYFKAKNGIEIISRSRMDIQTDRLWFFGCTPNERSGSMVFSSNEKRDREFNRFQEAILDWTNNYEAFSNDEKSFIKELGNETFEI